MADITSEQHNKYLAYAFFVQVAFQLFWTLLMVLWFAFVLGSFPTNPDGPGPPAAFFGIFITFILIVQFVFTAPSVIAGWAMLRKKPWARMAGIVAAVVSAMSVPIGTAACVYSLWFFLGDKWKEVYAEHPGDDDTAVRGLSSADAFRSSDEHARREEWMKQPPDWR